MKAPLSHRILRFDLNGMDIHIESFRYKKEYKVFAHYYYDEEDGLTGMGVHRSEREAARKAIDHLLDEYKKHRRYGMVICMLVYHHKKEKKED